MFIRTGSFWHPSATSDTRTIRRIKKLRERNTQTSAGRFIIKGMQKIRGSVANWQKRYFGEFFDRAPKALVAKPRGISSESFS
jgi:hypothetical protein